LDGIELWSKDPDTSPIYWLNGLAGTGKSTIAQTFAERLFADGWLGASFFCSRDFEDRRNLHCIFPTLAFQLAHKYPGFRSTLIPLLQSNPDIGYESLFNQMRALIVEPLSLSDVSTVIVIDALDECADEEPQSAILSVMGRLVEGIPKVKFLITGRPEPRIQSGFRLGLLQPLTDIFVLHEVEPSIVNTDIQLFLEHGLSQLAKRSGIEQDVWPTDKHLDLLRERAAGLFVYAVATLKFLDHAFTPPSERLNIIVMAPGSTTHEGKAKVRLSGTLDSLYLSTFQSAFGGVGAEDDEKVCFVISAVVLAVNPLPPSAIATLVELGKQEVMGILQLIQSLLKLSEDPDSPVVPFHKSFPDFITDPLRCPDQRFHISPSAGHLKLALSCLKLMNNSLEQNILSLPNYALNSEVEDLEERTKSYISVALEYACKSWHSHLAEARGDVVVIIPVLHSFMQERFLAWLEVISVTGAARNAVVALEKLMLWLQEVCLDHSTGPLMLIYILDQVAKDYQLLNIARDYFRFTTNFYEVINVSATHIYHSALELSPLSSVVRKLYHSQQPHPSPRVVIGVPDLWDDVSASVFPIHSLYQCSVWSPCGHFIAAATEDAVEIRGALALNLLFTLQLARATNDDWDHYDWDQLAYSPDGHCLTYCSCDMTIIWDTQTGGVVGEFHCEVTNNRPQLVWSLDNGMIGIISWVQGRFIMHIYKVTSGKMQSFEIVSSTDDGYLWAHDKSFWFMTAAKDDMGLTIDIYEVGTTLTKVEQYHLHSLPSGVCIHLFETFSPTTYRICTSSTSETFILDICSSEVLLQEPGPSHYPTFSPDGNLFAAFIRSGLDYILIWRYTSGHFVQWRKFQQTLSELQFSPTLSSILGCSSSFLCVLDLGHFPTTPTIESGATICRIWDAYPSNGAYIATAHYEESAITITNLQLQNPSPSQFIDTGFEILTMVLTGNVLLVQGSDTVIAWRLTEEGVVDGTLGERRVDCSNSIWNVPSRALNQSVHDLHLSVQGECAGIGWDGDPIHVYNTETGEILNSNGVHPDTSSEFYNWNHFHNHVYKHCESPECCWPVSVFTLEDGWVKDPEGKHRLWLHPYWRSQLSQMNWLGQLTLRLRLGDTSEVFVIKF